MEVCIILVLIIDMVSSCLDTVVKCSVESFGIFQEKMKVHIWGGGVGPFQSAIALIYFDSLCLLKI
jgi:hypothetical protein